MRVIVMILAAAGLTAGCVVPLENQTSSGSDGGAKLCDGRNDCNSCASCALNGPCASLFNQCMADADCTGVDQCVGLCGTDAACKDQCYANNPAGAGLYGEVTGCLYCDQCPSDCPGVQSCN